MKGKRETGKGKKRRQAQKEDLAIPSIQFKSIPILHSFDLSPGFFWNQKRKKVKKKKKKKKREGRGRSFPQKKKSQTPFKSPHKNPQRTQRARRKKFSRRTKARKKLEEERTRKQEEKEWKAIKGRNPKEQKSKKTKRFKKKNHRTSWTQDREGEIGKGKGRNRSQRTKEKNKENQKEFFLLSLPNFDWSVFFLLCFSALQQLFPKCQSWKLTEKTKVINKSHHFPPLISQEIRANSS